MSATSLRRGPATPPRLALTRRPRVGPLATAPVSATILLVEDDPEVRAIFAGFLRHAGYSVIEAADGTEALTALRERHGHVDVIVTDVVMPHVDGPALVDAVRSRQPDVRVLYVSGYDVETEPAADDAPETRHLRKPLTRTMLLDQVAALLGRGHSPARREAASEFD